MIEGLLTGVGVSIAWMLCQVGLMHIRPADSRLKAMFVGYLVSLPLVYLAYRWLPLPATFGLGLCIAYIVHLLLFLLYAECFFHVERAVTLRFLVEMLQHPDKDVPLEELMRDYNVRHMVEGRLKSLLDREFIEERDGTWRLKPKGRIFAQAMFFSKWVFRSNAQHERL